MLEKLTLLAVCYYSYSQSINISNLFLVEITNDTAKTVHEHGNFRVYFTLDVICKGDNF